jgi:hypothetical protein
MDKPSPAWYTMLLSFSALPDVPGASGITSRVFSLRKVFFCMKQAQLSPFLALLGGIGAFLLRLLYRHTGFEADTGLPIPGSLPHTLSLVLLIVLAVLLLLAIRALPREKESVSFSDAFSTANSVYLSLVVGGIFMLSLSGLYDLYLGLLVNRALSAALSGLLSLVSAISLFPVLPLCRKRPDSHSRAFRAELLLVPVCCLVARLVIAYRSASENPFLSAYAIEMLALVLLTLGFYRLSSFAFQCGKTRRFALYTLWAVAFSIAALADSHSLSDLLLYLGGACTLLGFLFIRLDVLASPEGDSVH